MADIQKQFEEFHEAIRIDYDMSEDLRAGRDAIVRRITKHLAENSLPGISVLLQGSYKMKTGVKPIADLEYDIDVGLRFSIRPDEYDAATVRGWVASAVADHTSLVESKGPCDRVVYKKGYHVDLVSYAVSDQGGGDNYALAHASKGWRPANPPGLLDYVNSYRKPRFSDTTDGATKTDQFRRCVRYLRRWSDVRKPYESDDKPTGLAFVLLCIQQGLAPALFLDARPDDRIALLRFVDSVALATGRISAIKPTPEHEDLFGRIGDEEMNLFRHDLMGLRDSLTAAGVAADPVDACKELRRVFGEDFPVPDPEDTAKATSAPAIITSSKSA